MKRTRNERRQRREERIALAGCAVFMILLFLFFDSFVYACAMSAL